MRPEYNEFIKSVDIVDVVIMKSSFVASEMHDPESKYNVMQSFDGPNLFVMNDYFVFEMTYQLELLKKGADSQNTSGGTSVVKIDITIAALYTAGKDFLQDEFKEIMFDFYNYSAVSHIQGFCRKHIFDLINSAGYPRFILSMLKSRFDTEPKDEVDNIKD